MSYSSVIISNNGSVLGKTRKNHIPRIGDFNEVKAMFSFPFFIPFFLFNTELLVTETCCCDLSTVNLLYGGRHRPPSISDTIW